MRHTVSVVNGSDMLPSQTLYLTCPCGMESSTSLKSVHFLAVGNASGAKSKIFKHRSCASGEN